MVLEFNETTIVSNLSESVVALSMSWVFTQYQFWTLSFFAGNFEMLKSASKRQMAVRYQFVLLRTTDLATFLRKRDNEATTNKSMTIANRC